MNNQLISLVGRDFGIYRVLAQAPRRDNNTRWLCRCLVCGAEVSKRSASLRANRYERCDGRHNSRIPAPSPLRKPEGWAAATETYGHYRSSAKARSLTFSLTRDEFQDMTARDCHYCGSPPSQRHFRRHYNGAFIYNGIDRKNSDMGYESGNCVPCCASCNVMKQDLSYEGFLSQIARIHDLHGSVARAAVQRQEQMSMGQGGNFRTANIEIQAPPIFKARHEAVMALRTTGKTIPEIMEVLNLSRSSVYRAITQEAR